jgi:small nuclear ribonucleoprotein (snRNP)-like protein
MTAQNRTGQRVRIILTGNRFYSGTILSEDNLLIVIKDKFGVEVSLGKSAIISMEVLE